MSQAGETAQQRDQVLATALHLWDEVWQGRAAEAIRMSDWPELSETVGGHLADRGGQLIRASELRDLLRTWLCPRRGRGPIGQPADIEFETFLVSWALSGRSDAVRRWDELGSPLRMDPAGHIQRAAGWGAGKPSAATLRYPYLDRHGVYPNGQAGELVDAAVARLLNVGAAWGEPRQSRLPADMRQRLTPAIAKRWQLFDTSAGDGGTIPTEELTRLAFTMEVGARLRRYVSRYSDPTSDSDEAIRALAAEVLPHWTDPLERRELLRLSVDQDLLGDMADGKAKDELGVPFADFGAVFRTFAVHARQFREAGSADTPPNALDGTAALRRLSVLLELAIADVLLFSDAAIPLDDTIANLIVEVLDVCSQQDESVQMLDIQRELRQPHPDRSGRFASQGGSLTYLTGLLERLATDHQFGAVIQPGRGPEAADGRDVQRLVDLATRYLDDDKPRPETILSEFADSLPPVVTALVSGNDAALPLESPADARWRLLKASGDALAKEPTTVASLTVASSFAELGWVVANEREPADMREVNDQLYRRLSEDNAGPIAQDVPGPLTRLMRVRPLADSKKANFKLAQRAAHESVIYGSRALQAAMGGSAPQVHRIVAALTGLQLSVLQAGGVFVRSAETELILRLNYSSSERRKEHALYIRDLATSAFTYTNLAVARLYDLQGVVKAGIVAEGDINYPTTAAASTAAMGMRTLLLWATMHLAYPNEKNPRQQPADISRLIPSIPGYFEKMLTLRHLIPLNFADMTRIAMHYAFLSGSFRHPARDAKGVHPATPEHLRPGQARLDLGSCGAYLRSNGFDTGILDVIELDAVRRLLDEKSQGQYQEWLSSYDNPARRSPIRFTRGELASASVTLRDPTIGW
jgi:hypothetical protein